MRDLRPTGSRKALPAKPGWGAEEARWGCLVSGNDFIQSPIVAGKQFPFTNRPAIVLLVPEEMCGWAGLHNYQCGPCQSPWLHGAGTAGRAQHGLWVPIDLGEAAWTWPRSHRLLLFCCEKQRTDPCWYTPSYLLPYPLDSIWGSLDQSNVWTYKQGYGYCVRSKQEKDESAYIIILLFLKLDFM